MKQQLLFFITFIICQQSYSQNVGIGTDYPYRAKLEVHGAVGATSAIFGGESSGISLQRNWPGIGYNQYYNTGSRYISNGYAAVQYFDPGSGYMAIDMFNNGIGNAFCPTPDRALTIRRNGNLQIGGAVSNAALSVTRNIGADATSRIFGTQYPSVFNYLANEDTYIRAGRDNGTVYINDIPGSKIFLGGFVGINTSTPVYPLEIRQVNGKGLAIVDPVTFNNWDLSMGTGGSGYLFLSFNGSTKGVFVSSSGEYDAVSDRRLKTNIHPLNPLLAKIMRLQPVEYRMKDDNVSNKNSIGFLAQDVKQLFPELVTVIKDTATGYKDISDLHTLNYSGFGVLAIKAIQEQQEIINELKTAVAVLQQENKNLINRIKVVEENTAGIQHD
jgi:Chaperone of endosialidase